MRKWKCSRRKDVDDEAEARDVYSQPAPDARIDGLGVVSENHESIQHRAACAFIGGDAIATLDPDSD